MDRRSHHTTSSNTISPRCSVPYVLKRNSMEVNVYMVCQCYHLITPKMIRHLLLFNCLSSFDKVMFSLFSKQVHSMHENSFYLHVFFWCSVKSLYRSLLVSLSIISCNGASSFFSIRLNSWTNKIKCLKLVFK